MRWGIALLVLAATASAQSNEKYYASIEKAIRTGGLIAVSGNISVEVIAHAPDWARKICAAAVNAKLTRLLRSKDKLKAAAEKIEQIGATCATNNPENAAAWSARADGLYFKLKVETALRNDTDTEQWIEAAKALVRLHDLEAKEGAPLERAVRLLRAGRNSKGTDGAKLKTQEDQICLTGIEAYPGNGFFAANTQAVELDAIVALIKARDFKAAKPRITALLARATDDTLYNDAVTVALAAVKKLHIKAKYRSTTQKFWDVFDIDVPMGSRWKVEDDAIKQYGRDGKLKRKFSFDFFKLNTLYYVGDKKYDGSNVKGMARITERDILGVIVKIKRRSKVIKKRLNRKISGVQYFVIGGYDKYADFVRFHSYVWKGKERDWLTYRMWIIEWADYKGLDPEAQFVLNGLRERKYKKK